MELWNFAIVQFSEYSFYFPPPLGDNRGENKMKLLHGGLRLALKSDSPRGDEKPRRANNFPRREIYVREVLILRIFLLLMQARQFHLLRMSFTVKLRQSLA